MIIFKLKGAMQSWGLPRIRGDYFPTDTKPTKSGIVGLIACVLGIERGDPQIEELNSALKVWVKSYDNDGIMTDFHVIHASADRPQYLADGTNNSPSSKQGMVTKRSYIQSGEFDIILEGDDELLNKISDAFRCPHWIPYLGRKSCAVSYPILPDNIDKISDEFVELKS